MTASVALHQYSLAMIPIPLYATLMRALSVVAIFALQLSIFTCGFDIHIHAVNHDTGHIAQHIHDDTGEHQQAPDYGCHIHTTHTFMETKPLQVSSVELLAFAQPHILKSITLKNLSSNIEYPPKA